jgi:hypothetical protein
LKLRGNLRKFFLKEKILEIKRGGSNRKGIGKKITKYYLYKLKKDIKNKAVNGGFWRRLKYVGFGYYQ